MRTSYGVLIRRPDDLPHILRRIASKRGRGKPYVVADLLRDCLIAYTRDHVSYQPMGAFEHDPETTVYVRGTLKERAYYIGLAKGQRVALGKILEAAILYHCGDDIAAMRRKDKKRVQSHL